MKLITNFINKFFVKQQVVELGRWNILYCQEKINKKIDLSNEDHCGTCYTHNTYNTNNTNNINNIMMNNKKIKTYDAKSLIFFETM